MGLVFAPFVVWILKTFGITQESTLLITIAPLARFVTLAGPIS